MIYENVFSNVQILKAMKIIALRLMPPVIDNSVVFQYFFFRKKGVYL
jgi:hypothetical protein